MSNQNVDGTVTIGTQVDQQSLKAGEQALVKSGQTIGKVFSDVEKKIEGIGKNLQATATKASKAIDNTTARSVGKVAEQESKALRIAVEQDQKRMTKIAEEESKKRIIIARRENSEAGISRQVTNADRFRRNNITEINAEIMRREGRRSPNLMQVSGSGGGRRGGVMGVLGRLFGGGGGGIAGGIAAGLLGGLGIGTGGYALARGVGAVVEATDQATAYDRQRIAAEKLAGSQEQLNKLLNAYKEASGGAIDQITSLETVTRLLATGYAKTAPQLERFVRATRGASLSLGKPQENIAQETQLAISNTSVKRLDQIGLGIEEVTKRTEELRDANKSMTREMAFGEAVLSLMEEKYGALSQSLEGQATGVEKLRAAWADFFLTLGQNSQGPVNTIAGTLARLINAYTLPQQQTEGTGFVPKTRAEKIDAGFNRFVEGLQDQVLEHLYGFDPTRIAAARTLQNRSFGSGMGTMDYVNGTIQSDISMGRDEQYQSMIDSSYDNIQQVEKNANRARLQEIENYESQRESIINNYGKMVVREEQDFARQRARSLRDYERAIVDVMRDAQDREREMQEDLDRQIAESKEDSNDRIADIEENYNDQREQAEKDHRDAMLKAVGQLDAIAVLEERKRFRRDQEERNKQHDKAIEEEKESLQERIDDAVEAHNERLEDAREADEKRLEDMRVARERQLADEDEDRRIRLERAAEDHQDQLNELDRQHAERMQRINDEAEEQTQAIETALAEDLAEAGYYIKGMTEIMNERKKLQEEWFDAMIERMERDIEYSKRREQIHDPRTTPERVIPEFARGGPVTQTGLAYVHAGEYVVPASNSNSQYSNSSLVIGDGAFRITTTPGMEMAVAEEIESVLIKLLERV